MADHYCAALLQSLATAAMNSAQYWHPLSRCSQFVLMAETIGEALAQGWRVKVRCAWGPREGMKRVRECVYGAELDLPTLVWTRGRDFPLGRLESRLKCPRCGSRAVTVVFIPPTNQQIAAGGR